jgi:hypothetical protein
MIVGLLLYSIALLFIPLAQGATLGAALLLIAQQTLGDGAATLYQINQVSLRQAITPARFLGRVNASTEFLRGSERRSLGRCSAAWRVIRSVCARRSS